VFLKFIFKKEKAMGIKEISDITGLSISTVSHALNGTRAVSQRSLKLVEDAAKKCNYRPNLAAQILKTNKSKIIALIIPSTEPENSTNVFYFEVLSGAQSKFEQLGYNMVISTYHDDNTQMSIGKIPMLEKYLVDGVLLVPPKYSQQSVDDILSSGLPLVVLDRRLEREDLSMVYTDNITIVTKAVRLLAESGKKNIAYLGGDPLFPTCIDRHKGYQDALSSLGVAYRSELVKTGLSYCIESGYQAAEELMASGADAFFVANSVLTMGVLKCFHHNNIEIPGQASIIGFDDYEWAEIVTPPITAIYQNAYQMGEEGANSLIDKIEKRGNENENRKVVLSAKLVFRQSH